MDTPINAPTFERYLSGTNLSEQAKNDLRNEFKTAKNPTEVYNKLVRMAGRKSMTKVPTLTTK